MFSNNEIIYLFAVINDKYRKIEKYLLILLFKWYYTLSTSYLYQDRLQLMACNRACG